MKYRCLAAALVLWAGAPIEAPAQYSGGGTTPPDSIIIRCNDCGTITSVRETQTPRQSASPNVGGGAAGGVTVYAGSDAPVGLVARIPFGEGSRTESKPFVGAVGSREWQNIVSSTSFEFTVRMDDGSYRVARKLGVSDFQIGDRVRLLGERIERLGG